MDYAGGAHVERRRLLWSLSDILEINLDKIRYCLVACNLSGANTFFFRKKLVADKFLKPFTAQIFSNRQDTTYLDTPQGIAPLIKLWQNRF